MAVTQRRSRGVVSVVVHLLVYSGRPDPSWELGKDALGELSGFLRKLPSMPKTDTPMMSRLGYHGFLLTLNHGQGPATKLHVFKGLITLREGEKMESRWDKIGLEDWLLGQAKEHGFGDLLSPSKK